MPELRIERMKLKSIVGLEEKLLSIVAFGASISYPTLGKKG